MDNLEEWNEKDQVLTNIINLFLDDYNELGKNPEEAYVGIQIDVAEDAVAIRWYELTTSAEKSLRPMKDRYQAGKLALRLWKLSEEEWGSMFVAVSSQSMKFTAVFKTLEESSDLRIAHTEGKVAIKELRELVKQLSD